MDALARVLARRRVTLGFVFAIAVLYFAAPTRESLLAGAAVGMVGEAIRIWAAGHLEKSREVTTSGPYRFTRHPLYLGSSIMARYSLFRQARSNENRRSTCGARASAYAS